MRGRDIPEREVWAPTTALQGRIAIFSPTDRPTLSKGKPVHVKIGGGKNGGAIVAGYRPTMRDKMILEAIFTVGSTPDPGSGVVEFEVKRAAKIADCGANPSWMLEELWRISRAEISLYDSDDLKGFPCHRFRILSSITKLDGGRARVQFSLKYLHLWAIDIWVHSERITAEVAAIKSPVVRALVERNLTHGQNWDETLDAALYMIDALRVNDREVRERKAQIRAAADDGTLARFGITLERNVRTDVEHVVFDRRLLDGDGLRRTRTQEAERFADNVKQLVGATSG